jgi:PST family polysaccharide transporter
MITLVAILSSNLSLIIIRDFITTNISIDAAGYWQGIWTLSQVSLGLITTSLSIYFLPTLSAIKVKSDISKELKSAIRVILPVAVLISFSIYILKDFIILVLYTEEFNPMKELFLWQMIGNTIKVAGWLFGYVLVAKAMVRYTVSIEIIFATIFVLLSIYLVNIYGLIGVTYSYTINNILHFFTMYYIYKYKIN